MKKIFYVFAVVAILFSCQTATQNDIKRLVAKFNFKYVHYIYYDSDDSGWQNQSGTITIDENIIEITTNDGVETITDAPLIKSVKYDAVDNDYLYKTSHGSVSVKMNGDSIKEVSIFSSNGTARFTLEKS